MIGALEDAIICRLREAFDGRVKEVDHKPARFDAEELQRVLSNAPAIYVAFLGWQRVERPPGCVRATFGAYIVAANASGEVARRRGDQVTIGAYEMAILTAATLERWLPSGAAGPMEVQSCENLYATAFEKAGRTVYGLVCDVPMQIQDDWLPALTLDNFITFHGDVDIPPFGNVATPPPAPDTGANRADAVVRITLPTP